MSRFQGWIRCLAALLVFQQGFSTLHADRPPTQAMVERFKRDGTWEKRLAVVRARGHEKPDPILAENARLRLRQAVAREKDLPMMAPQAAERPTAVPTKGTLKSFVMLITFSDQITYETRADMQAKIFGDGVANAGADFPNESLRNWYRRSSYNQLELTGNVLGWYQAPYPRSAVPKTEAGRQGVIKEAIGYFKAQGHDFAQYDNNGDGVIDFFSVVWTGVSDDWAEFWWPYMTIFMNDPFTVDGKKLGSYIWETENNPRGNVYRYSAGTLIHEVGHVLGLPDYYDYDSTVGPNGGIGGFGRMDGGEDHEAFSKFLLGWISPQILTAAKPGLALRPLISYPDAAILIPDSSAHGASATEFGEYFLIENHRPGGNNGSYALGDGLAIWHVDTQPGTNGGFQFNNSWTSHKLLRLMEADGKEEIEHGAYSNNGNAGDLWGKGQTFGPTTFPSSALYDGSPSRLGVRNISAPGEVVTFDVFAPPADATAPIGAPAAPRDGGPVASSETLAFTWTQGTALDPDTGIEGYELRVGTRPESNDEFQGGTGAALTWNLPGRGQEGRLYFAQARALDGALLPSGWSGSSQGVAVSLPTVASEAAEAGTLLLKTSGDAPWVVDQTDAYAGGSSLRSPVLTTPGASTFLEGRFQGPGLLSFWSKGPTNGASFYYNVDGQHYYYLYDLTWTRRTVSIPAGLHVIRWIVLASRDSAESSRIDNIDYQYQGAATAYLTDLTPTAAHRGDQVVLTGGGLSGAAAVTFDGVPATFQVLEDRRIQAVVPPLATSGLVRVQVGGTTLTAPLAFVVVGQPSAAPTLTGFSPAAAPPQGRVILTGTRLGEATAVLFNGTPASIFSILNATTISAVIPTWASSGAITVLTPTGAASSSPQVFQVVSPPSIKVSPEALPTGVVGRAYSQTLTASGGTAPYTFNWSNPMPAGLWVTPGGVVMGTPTLAETRTFNIYAIDALGFSGGQDYTLTIAATATIAVSPATLPAGKVGQAYNQPLSASGGTAPYAFSVASGTLPAGIALSNGALIGTPTTAGASTFTIQAMDATGSQGRQSYTLTIAGAAAIHWRHSATGQVYVMPIHGATVLPGAVAHTEPDPAWQIVGTGDLDADGTADLIWWNSATGQVYGMLMDGTRVKSGAIMYTEPNTSWRVAGIADLTGDGRPDLLWRNTATGQVYLMPMNGMVPQPGAVVWTEPSMDWQIVTAADATGDGKADIIWWNSRTGAVFLMQVNGLSQASGSIIYTEPNTDWKIVGSGDFDGKGTADLLWRNVATGGVYRMPMLDGMPQAGGLIWTEPQPAWQIVSIADFDGDGKADILWWNSGTGSVYQMLMDGMAIRSSGLIYTEPDTRWTIQAGGARRTDAAATTSVPGSGPVGD